MNQYYLFLQTTENKTSNSFSDKQLILCSSLIEIDDFTKDYSSSQDLADEINYTTHYISFKKAIIIFKTNINKIKKSNNKLPIKEEKVLFQEDKEFIEKIKKDIYGETIIEEYKNFLFNHRKEIKTSLLKYIKIGIEVDESILDNNLNQLFYAYYKNRTYKKIRDTYIDLKEKKKKYIKVRSKE